MALLPQKFKSEEEAFAGSDHVVKGGDPTTQKGANQAVFLFRGGINKS